MLNYLSSESKSALLVILRIQVISYKNGNRIYLRNLFNTFSITQYTLGFITLCFSLKVENNNPKNKFFRKHFLVFLCKRFDHQP